MKLKKISLDLLLIFYNLKSLHRFGIYRFSYCIYFLYRKKEHNMFKTWLKFFLPSRRTCIRTVETRT